MSDFVYDHFPLYTGIDFSRVLPSDRLREELKISEVAWSDWDFDFIEDFRERFDVNLLKANTIPITGTLAELATFLTRELATTHQQRPDG